MSHIYATPLELELTPSRRETFFVYGIYGLTLLSIWQLPWPLWGRLIFLCTVFVLVSVLRRRQKKYSRIVWQAGNHWLITSKGVTDTAMLQQQSLVTTWLVILLFKITDHGDIAIVIWPDSIQPNVFRRLRVRLKLEAESLFATPE